MTFGVSFGGNTTLPATADAATTTAYVFGMLGNIIAVTLSVSSLYPFITICRNRAVEPEPLVVPQMAALLNGVVWGMLGLPCVQPGSEVSLAVNAIGVVCMMFCTVTFLCFAGEDRCFPFFFVLAFEVMITVMAGSLVVALPGEPKTKAFWVGVCGDVTTVLTYLVQLRGVLACDHQNVDRISLPMAVGALLNAVVWVIYSCVHGFNTIVFIPNMIGVLVLGLLLVVYFRYRQTPADEGPRV